MFSSIYFSSSKDDGDERRELRDVIYEIIKYCIQCQIRMKDINILLSTISTISVLNDEITYELLEFIVGLLNPSSIITETIIEYLCEPNMIEGLYSLLVVNNLSSKTKEMVLKIMKYFIGSQRVSQQVRAQLRLETNHIGFGGIISGIAFNELNQSIVEEILNLIITSRMFSSEKNIKITFFS
jgi:hypothetical protein